ncbi:MULTISPECIES: hypothetical protein [unclassified Rhizobium]|uniref:hypothetical protein n=1 Tax=unclassified Rhizobium TaxID=2613769 RepID=UPI0006FD19C0|nr:MULTISPECIES: hypothetical protein [unclassified Rhizobium]
MKSILKKIRLPRKAMFAVAGVLLLSGASGAYALFMVQGKDEEKRAPSVSGLACTTVETLKMRRNGQRWIRKYITVEKGSGEERVRTALRVAGLLVHAEKADLYQVAVLDTAGPKERADWRGAAIGAQVLFAPDPKIVPGMSNLFSARYSDSEANTVGLYYGQDVSLSQDKIKDTLTSIVEKTECADPVPVEGAEGSEAGEHGEAASEKASGHGEAAEAEGHGGEAKASEEGHGEKPAEGHGEEAAAEGHGEAASGEKSEGMLASITGMIFGSGEEKPEAAGHGEAAPAEDHAAKPEEHAEAEKPGMFASVKAMIFGDGEAAAPAETKDAHAQPEEHSQAAEPKAEPNDMTAEAETKKEPAVH